MDNDDANELVFYDKDVMLLFEWVAKMTCVPITCYSE